MQMCLVYQSSVIISNEQATAVGLRQKK